MLPSIRVAITVAIADAPILTKLLPIRIAISIFWGLLFNMNNDLAPRLRSFSSAFALPLDRAIRAVSDAEKNAEQINRSTKHTPPNIILGPKQYGDISKTEVQILRLPMVMFSLRVKQQKITGSTTVTVLNK
jgi:hypothetical protein